MALIHDVMHEVFAVTCVYACAVLLDRVLLCSVELLIDWIVVPCFVSVVSRTSQSTPLPLVVSNDITGGMVNNEDASPIGLHENG